MENNYYVYIYLDPRKPGNYIYNNLKFNFEPFYVGKGKNIRITKGLDDPNNNKSKKYKISEIRKCGLEPITIKIYDNLSENISYELEKLTIKKIGREKQQSVLVNITKGSTSYKKELNLYINKNIIVNVICIISDFYYLNDGSYFHKNLFLDIFTKYI